MRFSPPLEFKAPDPGGSGTFVGYAAIFDTVDLGGDVIQPGAFTQSLARHKARGLFPSLLWSHDPDTVIGTFTELREDDKGLYAGGKLTLATQAAKDAYALLKDRAVSGLSIGYDVPAGGAERRDGSRLLHKIELLEISLVAVPMHQDARIVAVKSALACSHPRELEQLFRSDPNFGLSSRKARTAAAALWPILRQGDDRDDPDAESKRLTALAEELDSLNLLLMKETQT